MLNNSLRTTYIGLLFFVLLTGWTWYNRSIEPMEKGTIYFPTQELNLQLEIAKTEKQRAQGLMFRPSLALNKGMLFVFEQEAIQRVWMKNTLISLDIIFFSSNKEIVSIIQDLKPCKQAVCKIYSSSSKATYMLEVNSGIVKKERINVGQKVIFDILQ